MARDKQIKVWVDAITAARLTLRAEEAGTTVSEYMGDLIARDAARSGVADALAPELLEMQTVGAILIRGLLEQAIGQEEAARFMERAQAKAVEQTQAALLDLQATRAGA